MRSIRESSRLSHFIVMIVTLALGVGIGVGALAVAGGNEATYYACVNNNSGTIHVIDVSGTCTHNEMRISWNQQGPSGPQGIPGADGASGPQGPTGPAGQDGADGTFSGTFTSSSGAYQLTVADDGIHLIDNVSHQHIDMVPGGITISGIKITTQSVGSTTITGGGLVTITGIPVTINGLLP